MNVLELNPLFYLSNYSPDDPEKQIQKWHIEKYNLHSTHDLDRLGEIDCISCTSVVIESRCIYEYKICQYQDVNDVVPSFLIRLDNSM